MESEIEKALAKYNSIDEVNAYKDGYHDGLNLGWKVFRRIRK